MNRRTLLLWTAAAALMFSVGFIAVRYEAPATDLGPSFAEPGVGHERAVILVVSSRCVWCYHPDLEAVWTRILENMETRLPATMDRLVTAAMVQAGSPMEGFEFVSRFGSFHEITAGRAQNTAALRYVIHDFRGPRSTPQVVVVDREFSARGDDSIQRDSEVVVQRLVGAREIIEFAARAEPPARPR